MSRKTFKIYKMKKQLQLIFLFLISNQLSAQFCFTDSLPFNFGNNPEAIISGDFNNDGKLDIAEFNDGQFPKALVVSLGNGLGNFATPTAATTTSLNNSTIVGAIAAGNFNSDLNLDLVIMAGNHTPIIFFGNGLGKFTASTGSNPFPSLYGNGLTVGYFNSDGLMDVAVSDDRRIFIGFSDGTGFSSFTKQIAIPVGLSGNINTGKGALVNADFNNDGHYDFAVSNEDDSSFSVLLNDGTNNFPFVNNYQLEPNTSFDRALKSADFNGDGILDLLTIRASNFSTGFRGIKVYLGDGTGSFPTIVETSTTQYSDFVIADFDGDTILDVASNMGTYLTVLKGNGNGSFGNGTPFFTSQYANAYFIYNNLVGADFNNDGKIDIATANYNNNTDGEKVSIFLNKKNKIVTTTPNSRCGSGTVVLAATTSTGNTINWYNSATGGTILFTGASFTTPILNATTSYFAEANNLNCTSTRVEVIATINPNVTPTFTQVNAICSGATLSALTLNSTNGIAGTWSPALNNLATTLYTFTPTSGQCATTATMTITVNQNVTPIFTQVNAICSGATLSALPLNSTNGIAGTWSPALNNLATTLYTFTPTAGQCATTATMSITITPNVTPTFTQVTPKCSGSTIAALPADSINGINGSWSPAINNTTTTLYTFTPTAGQCATSTTMSITITPNVTPTFTQVTPKCSGTTIAALPADSINGINGSWSPAINNTTTTLYTFTPTAGQCATSTTMSITINAVVAAPTGAANQTFCAGETVGNLAVSGTSVVWYNAATLGTIVSNSTVLVAGTTYYASQTISNCDSNTRLAVIVSNGGCLANETFELLNLKVFPNPVKDILNLSFDKEISNVSIFNVLGQEVISKSIKENESKIDMSRLPSGTYFLKIYSDNLVKTVKVIKE
jgi:Ig-like domain CHU_C associated/Secretion system C-terminal sorting domain/FG-GAP-like repeat